LLQIEVEGGDVAGKPLTALVDPIQVDEIEEAVTSRRRLDVLGRVVIPASIRKGLGFEIGDELSISVRDDALVIRKSTPTFATSGAPHVPMPVNGRVVIPASIRKGLGFEIGDALSLSVRDDALVIRKSTPSCAICRASRVLTPVNNGYLCQDCVAAVGRERTCVICKNDAAIVHDRGGILVCETCLNVIGAGTHDKT
jgi:AbrB family looped-hinge helix DNA binding protein